MKKYFAYILALAAALNFASCNQELLETTPTDRAAGTGMFANANAALVPLNGIYRLMYTQGWSTTGNVQQCDGLTAWNLCADVMGDDCIMAATGSGWYWYDAAYNVKSRYTQSSWRSYDLWNGFYTLIANANYIIAAGPTMEGDPADVNYVVGQAYAIRAYCYHMLASYFSRPYLTANPADQAQRLKEKCVPIYTEPTGAGTPGKPRASIGDVYTQVRKDIDTAVIMLQTAPKQKHKTHIDYAVANGLKARICLTTGDWAAAETAAKAAQTGYTIGDAATITSGMNSLKNTNVMWGAEVITDQTPGWGPILYHMDGMSMLALGSQVYGFSAPKCINLELYAKMGTTDVRRAWWLSPTDAIAKYMASDAETAAAFLENVSNVNYIQDKFRFSDASQSLGDKMWMRVEEMYLSEAEAICRQGGRDAEAVAVLMKVMEKRDPSYTCAKTGSALVAQTYNWTGSLLEEILIQRRIELWGEYGRLFDIRRCGQGFTRTAAQGWPAGLMINATRDFDKPDTWAWVLTIPQAEFDGNENLDQAVDQNPTILKGQPEDPSVIYVTEDAE